MTTTLAWAASHRAVEYVTVFLVEGCEIAYCDYHDPAAIKAIWTATGHGTMTADWRGGLEVEGTLNSRIKLFDPKVEADTVTVKLLDSDDYLIGLTQAEALTTSARTVLRSSCDANDTSIGVQGVGGFAASGTIHIGHERITYASTTGGGTPTFNTCVRGTLALFETNSGTDFAYPHGVGTSIADGAQGVEVYSTPRVWLNRRCALYVLHREGGTWVSGSSPLMLWAGRIKSIADGDDGFISFEVSGIAEYLDSLVFSQQYQADLEPGAFFAQPGDLRLHVEEFSTSPSYDDDTYYNEFIDASAAGSRWTHQDIASGIAHQLSLADQTTGFLGANWSLKLERMPGVSGERYVFRFEASDTARTYKATIHLPALAWAMLGWYGEPGEILEISTYLGSDLQGKSFPDQDGSDVYTLVAPNPPLLQHIPVRLAQELLVDADSVKGVWLTQPNIPDASIAVNGYGADGFMMIDGKYLVGVNESGDNFTVTHAGLGRFENIADGVSPLGLAISIPDDGSNRAVTIRQAWIEYGDVATLMLRLALSTGTPGNYNHATYDDLEGVGFGVGIPASLLDIDSWLGIQGSGYWLVLDKPKKFSEILEDALSVRGAYLVWRRGELALARPGEASNGDGTYTLTESNKADTKLTRYKRSSDAIINVCKLKYNRTMGGQYLTEGTVRAGASISDLGERKPVTIEASGVYEGLLGQGGGLDEAIETMSTALAYFSRPICEVTRSYSHALMGMAAGDTVNLTDERVVDPTTGTRGVTLWPCWVSETRWNHHEGKGECTLVFLPEFNKDQRARWAPSAEVASSSVTSSRLTVTCTAHKYTPSTDTATDASYLSTAGMVCRIVEVSPTNPASPTTYTGLVVHSSGTNTITFTTDPASGALATSKRWVVEFEDYSTVTAGQQSAHAFIALETTRRILTVLSSFYRTWLPEVPYVSQAVDYTNLHRKRVNLADDDGEPHSVHWYIDAANSINTEYSAGTRQLLVCEMFDTDRTVSSATQTHIAGPIFVPLYGYNRTLTIRARAACSGGGTATIGFIASNTPPSGTSSTAFTFADDGDVYGQVTTTSATQVYTTSSTIVKPSRMQDGRMHGCWLTILGSASAGTATVTGIEVYETVLT